MNDNEFKVIKIGLIAFGVIFIIMTVFAIIGIRCCFVHGGKDSPVEERNDIDSLIAVNDSIKINVENLDSIKNAKVIEVKALDNDSTVKLFYKLVSE